MEISKQGVAFIAEFEGFSAKPYKDPIGIPTIGYGTIMYPNGKKVTMADKAITRLEGLEYLMDHINRHVEFGLDAEINQAQYDAIVSFIYNLGAGAFSKSTLKKKIEAEADCKVIAAEFKKWTKAGGRVLPGLVRRRDREAKLFCTGKYV